MAKINYRDFVVDWTTSENIEELMKTTKLSRFAIRYREKILRNAGVNLKELLLTSRGLDRLEVAQLNSLINKHTRK